MFIYTPAMLFGVTKNRAVDTRCPRVAKWHDDSGWKQKVYVMWVRFKEWWWDILKACQKRMKLRGTEQPCVVPWHIFWFCQPRSLWTSCTSGWILCMPVMLSSEAGCPWHPSSFDCHVWQSFQLCFLWCLILLKRKTQQSSSSSF